MAMGASDWSAFCFCVGEITRGGMDAGGKWEDGGMDGWMDGLLGFCFLPRFVCGCLFSHHPLPHPPFSLMCCAVLCVVCIVVDSVFVF